MIYAGLIFDNEVILSVHYFVKYFIKYEYLVFFQ
jgi:hypothetical protein